MTVPVESPPVQKRKKSSLALTLSATGLLIGSGVATYWLLTQGRLFSGELLTGAHTIPQDALLAVSMTTNPNQWEKLRKFGTTETQAALDQNLLMLRDRFLTSHGYDFQRDIQPWVGNRITFAILAPQNPVPPPKPVSTNAKDRSQEEPVVMILPIKSLAKAQQIWSQKFNLPGDKSGDTAKQEPRETTYAGTSIQEIKSKSGTKFSTAIIDQRFLAIADNSNAIKQTIDTYKSTTSLATSEGFAKNFPKIATHRPFAQFYVNVPASAQIAAAAPNRRLPAQVLAQLKENQGLAGTISLKSSGIRLQGISWLNPNSRRQLVVENQGGEMAKLLPPETLMMLSGSNLRRLWKDYVSTSKGNPFSPVAPEELKKSVKEYTSLDLDRDLLSWMGGEFSVSVVPNLPREGIEEDFRAALLFLIKASDRPKAELFFTKLDEIMKTQYQFQIQQGDVAGTPVVKWIAPFGTLTGTHGWLDKDVSFLVLGAPVTNRIIPSSRNSLANSQSFQNTVPSQPNPSNGQLFLDVERSITNFPLPNLFPNQKMILGATRSIGVTSAVSDSRSRRYDIFVEFKKVKE
ncbi:MAG: DUF3352 domain-containing protein [Calothrix sp. MO_167.B12]|nr:DUF3352 domain-containing protein [Calothrix sp. MO_167.B12]